MSIISDAGASAPPPMAAELGHDHRGSPIPTGAMIATRLMELRRRRDPARVLAVMT